MIPGPETFYTPYGSEFQNVRENNLPHTSYAQPNMMQGQQQLMSGIDPTYLAAYSNNNAQYVAGHQAMHREMQMERQMQFRCDPSFGSDYQNRNLAVGRGRATAVFSDSPRQFEHIPRVNSYDNKPKLQGVPQTPLRTPTESPRQFEHIPRVNSYDNKPKLQGVPQTPLRTPTESPRQFEHIPRVNSYDNKPKLQSVPQTPHRTPIVSVPVPPKKPNETETPKNELQSQVMTRFDKLKALHKSGPRAFTGPVEKVLKWHKALQDIGVLIIFEIIAKCVSIQPGQSSSKNLVVRDDNGPAMQVVYYEIDFLLPDLKPPCTVRVVGRMMAGTCRLQAFNVRPATGDDVATLPRRAAVATHHVAKLCKEYGPNVDKL